MVVKPAVELSEKSDTRALRASGSDHSDEQGTAFDAGLIWLASSKEKNVQQKMEAHHHKHVNIPSLPDLDLHSKLDKDPDHTSKHSVAEDLIDDLNTLINNDKVKVTVRNQQSSDLLTNAGTDLPVINCEGVPPGQIGVLMSKNKDGHTYYTPFVAAEPDVLRSRTDHQPLSINEAAAKELHIDEMIKKGLNPKVDVIAVPWDGLSGRILPKTKEELNQVVLEKLHDIAEDVRERQAKDREAAEANLPDPPAPDPEFGYRRTDRTPEQLRQIQDAFRQLSRDSMKAADPAGVQDRMKEFGKQAQKDIDKYTAEIDKKSIQLQTLERQQERLNRQSENVSDKESPRAKALAARIQSADDNAKTTSAALQTAQYNLSYAQNELKLSKDVGKFTRHMQAKASAAAIMSMNPDMEGSLTGHRVVVNAGHYPEDPKFPGFEKDDTAEWKLNLESEDVGAAMIKMAGGAVKLVNQADLKDKSMTGLANAIKAAKPEAAIAIHHDDGENPDDPAMKGTLTLQCAKSTGEASLDFAKAIHMAKVNYVGLDDRQNAKGVSVGIREQCGRGVQGRNVNAPFILDEQFSTHKDMWPLARDPKVNAEVQFSHVVSIYEFLNKTPRYKISQETGKVWREKIWSKTDMDDVFSKHPKVGAW